MADINVAQTDYVKFYIKSDTYGLVKMNVEPGGWKDDYLELNRSENHGIFNNFTESLEFYKEYLKIIESTFKIEGNNSSLYLIKKELIVNEQSNIVWEETYRGRADWESKTIKNNILKIRFNSNDIEEKLAANETDEFEIEITKSIDDYNIGEMTKYKTSIEGRNLTFLGKSVLDNGFGPPSGIYSNKFWYTPRTKLITRGNERHVTVDSYEASVLNAGDYGINNGESSAVGYAYFDKGAVASNMFFVDTVNTQAIAFCRIKYKIKASAWVPSNDREFRISLVYKKKNTGEGYTTINSDVLYEKVIKYNEPITQIDIDGFVDVELPYNVGVCLTYKYFVTSLNENVANYYSFNSRVSMQEIEIEGYTYYEPSLDLSFIFVHDAFSRLSEIILNKKDLFYSKYFGRKELGYEKDGEGGLIGLMSGFWARAFNEDSERYKSPKFSYKKLLDSCNAVFNVGMGSESFNGEKRIRLEKVKYFYQNKVVIRIGQVTNLERKYDKSLYFSGIKIGYNKGGDYENESGLDEPNTETHAVTPDRKSKNKYTKISDVRSDERGLEEVRRKPEFLYPNEDTRGDEHNWFLDLKRAFNGKFEQIKWQDRLQSEPEGVSNADTYRSFFFTPLRMLFRHGWILRSGLEVYLDKTIKYISSRANSNLKTFFIGEEEAFQENLPGGLKVEKLERSRFLPEEITFNYPVNRELINMMYGKTRVLYEGSYEDIPNYYFKLEFINEKQEKETGYLMNFIPSAEGQFKLQQANERII